MKAEEALAQSQGKKIYAVHHGDFITLYQREDGHYVYEFADLDDTNRRGMYISHSLEWTLKRDRRYIAEWYLTEEEARTGKRSEEFHIYTMALYQHNETKEVVHVKFCNGEIIGIATHRRPHMRRRSLSFDREELREFLLHSEQYTFLTCWWIQTIKQSDLDVQWVTEQAKRARSYHYIYFNLRDNQEHDEWHADIQEICRLVHAHVRGEKKKPLYIEGPGIGKIELHPQELPNHQFRIPELEPFDMGFPRKRTGKQKNLDVR